MHQGIVKNILILKALGEKMFQVSLLTSAVLLITFGVSCLTNTEPPLSVFMFMCHSLCVLLFMNLTNNLILVNYLIQWPYIQVRLNPDVLGIRTSYKFWEDTLPFLIHLQKLGAFLVAQLVKKKKKSAWYVGDPGSIPGLRRAPGKGNSYPLQYFGLANFMDCIVHGVTKSWIRLSNFHFTESSLWHFIYSMDCHIIS